MGVVSHGSGLTEEYSVLSRPTAARRPLFFAAMAWLLIDSALINLSFIAAYVARYNLQVGGAVEPVNRVSLGAYWQIQLWFWAFLMVLLQVEGLYRRRRQPSIVDQFGVIMRSSIVTGGIIAALSFVLKPPSQSRFVFLYMCVAAIVTLSLARVVAHTVRMARHRRGLDVRTVVVVGESNLAKMVLQRIAGDPAMGYRVAGFLGDSAAPSDFGRFHALGSVGQIRHVLLDQKVDEVVVALPATAHAQVMQVISECKAAGVDFAIVPDLFELSLSHVDMESLGGIPLLGLRENPLHGANLWIKRAIDIAVAGVALLLLALPMLIMAIAIRLDSPGSIIYHQVRVGKGGRTFKFYKIRSMVQNADDLFATIQGQNDAGRIHFKSRNDPRRTRVGRVMRRLSLDEVPQLFNVLKGDMSLVGPRPPRPHEYREYEDWMKARLRVTPGLTGLWQVSGRSDLTFDEMILLDLYYIESWSPGLDLKILLQTVPALLTGRGAY